MSVSFPLRASNLTTFSLEKLSSRAERGDLIVHRELHEIAAVASLLATTSTLLQRKRGGRPQHLALCLVSEATSTRE
jgi:hypothetical protein